MAEFHLPEFSVNADSVNEDILKLMKIIKPRWEESDIEIKTMSGGYSCSMYKVSCKVQPTDAVTLRIRNLFAEANIPGINRNFERKVIQIMSKERIFPKIYAMLKNGYCYQYIEGTPIFNVTTPMTEVKNVFDYEKFPFQLVAEKLAKIHSVKLEDEDFSTTKFFTNTLAILDNHYPDTSSPVLIDKHIVRKEFVKLMELSKNFKLNIVLCHGDPHPGNMVWNEEKNELTLVDWEVTTIGIQAFDIAYFLKSMTQAALLNLAGLSASGINDSATEDIKQKFIQLYVAEYSKLNNFELTEEYVSDIECQVKFCILVWYVTMTIYMGLIHQEMSEGSKLERLLPVGMEIYQEYLLIKDRILAELKLS